MADEKILIIKLGAKGDVVRTLPVLIAINEKYPSSDVYWITKSSSKELVQSSPYLKQVLSLEEAEELDEPFDILYNFDIDEEACNIASRINSLKKLGFYFRDGFPRAFNLGAEYYLNTLFDDELKKTNKKTYQEMMFQAAELEYQHQNHPILLSQSEKEYADNFIKKSNISREKLIGIHLGAGPRWPSKAWHEDNVREFIKKASKKGYEILLFVGPDELSRYSLFVETLKKENIKISLNNPLNSDLEFASLVNLCSQMVCSDSFALHVSLALKKPTLGLFFCTSPDEVEGYRLLKKIVSPMLSSFFPERMNEYSEELVKSIPADEVLSAISLPSIKKNKKPKNT